MEELSTKVAPRAAGPPPVSAHFVNNVLAAAASYIDEDPDYARDVLAELGQFLSYRLRSDAPAVSIEQELEHVGTYLRLQQARFPDRLTVVALAATAPGPVASGSVARALDGLLSRRLSEVPGPCSVSLHDHPDGIEVALGAADGDAGDIHLIPLNSTLEASR